MSCRDVLLILLLLMPNLGCPSPATAAMRTFPRGSVVIPVDPCWQPVDALPVSGGCASGGSVAGAAGAYGLAYRLQRVGVPVYRVAAHGPEEQPTGLSLSIHGPDGAPVAVQPGGVLLNPLAHRVEYRAAPFLVDARDLDPRAEETLAADPRIRRHHALVPFSAPVAWVLTGLPTRIRVGDQAAATRLATTLTQASLNGEDGLAVILADGTVQPAAGDALSGCWAEVLPVAPLQGLCGLPALFDDLAAVPTTTVSREVATTGTIVADGVLYAASFDTPGQTGHLRAFALDGSRQTRLWDAAERIPPPGSGLPATPTPELAPPFGDNPEERLLFTNLDAVHGFRLVNLAAESAPVLQPLIGVETVAAATALINATRGRLRASAHAPAGSGDRPSRLGAISRSSPALVGGSPVDAAAAERDQVIYAGAEDGLLHAFLVGRRLPAGGGYDHTAPGCGGELWGYLPGSLLPELKSQPFDEPGRLAAVHVDGAPLVSDLFVDPDGDGRREWRTILVGTASAQAHNRGVVFALDVTEPRRPRLLWETALPGTGLGRSRGAAIGGARGESEAATRVFVTAGTAGRVAADGSPAPLNGSYGVMACALDLADGRLLWQFTSPYAGDAVNLAEPPTAPALMSAVGSSGHGRVVFGDMAGRLWALATDNGAPLGGTPAWQSPGGAAEPIGGGVAVRNRLVLFGTGGVTHADDERTYAVYAVEILPEGGRLLWNLPLARGEKLWGAPTFDRFGRAYLGLGNEADRAGRLLMLAADGTLSGSVALGGAPCGGLTLVSGAVAVITGTGQVELVGELDQAGSASLAAPGQVRVFSWRVR